MSYINDDLLHKVHEEDIPSLLFLLNSNEKTFDFLEWNLICETLKFLRFDYITVKWFTQYTLIQKVVLKIMAIYLFFFLEIEREYDKGSIVSLSFSMFRSA